MRAVVQRVTSSSVDSEGARVGAIGRGFCVLLGVTHGDTEADARWLADKIAELRVFEDENGKLNRSLADVGGAMLIVSQFTLYGDCRRGRRPSFSEAPRTGERALRKVRRMRPRAGHSRRDGRVSDHDDGEYRQ